MSEAYKISAEESDIECKILNSKFGREKEIHIKLVINSYYNNLQLQILIENWNVRYNKKNHDSKQKNILFDMNLLIKFAFWFIFLFLDWN